MKRPKEPGAAVDTTLDTRPWPSARPMEEEEEATEALEEAEEDEAAEPEALATEEDEASCGISRCSDTSSLIPSPGWDGRPAWTVMTVTTTMSIL